jgi:uncharacterized protein
MLIEFSIGNYKSFKDIVTFSMVAANVRAKYQDVDENNVFKVDNDLSLLTSAAIYGANASGKSNLVAAIRFMRHFILNSSRETQITETIDVENFRLSTETEKKPSFFEMVFLLDDKKYRYGFEVNTRRVVSEWLYYIPTIREAKLFVRNLDDIQLTNSFKEGRGLTSRTRNNALFLSVVAQFNGEISKAVLRWFNDLNVSLGLDDVRDRIIALESFEDAKYQNDIIKFVKKLDLGVDNILVEKESIKKVPDLPGDAPDEIKQIFDILQKAPGIEQKSVKTLHRKYNSEGKAESMEIFDLDNNESDGTKKLFALAYPLLRSLRRGRILVIDELDARLHPLITCEIIRLFNSKETNPQNAQLIFTTHDTNLLNNRMFRRDQIWFAEKSKQGDTHLYSLVEYKIKGGDSKVRNDASFEKDYIEGRYGAIPFIGDFRTLIGEEDE